MRCDQLPSNPTKYKLINKQINNDKVDSLTCHSLHLTYVQRSKGDI